MSKEQLEINDICVYQGDDLPYLKKGSMCIIGDIHESLGSPKGTTLDAEATIGYPKLIDWFHGYEKNICRVQIKDLKFERTLNA